MGNPIARLVTARFSAGSIVGWLLTLLMWVAVAYLSISTWGDLRQVEWSYGVGNVLWEHGKDWLLWVTIGAAIIVALHPGKWLRDRARRLDESDSRSNLLVRGLNEIGDGTRLTRGHSFRTAHEALLQAAALALCEAFDVDREALKTNLIVALPPDQIQVVARSRPGSPVPITYNQNPGLAATQAMQQNKTVVVSNIPPKAGKDHRSYTTVVATPIFRGTRCYGVVTADSPHGNLFKGREAVIDRILSPYAAAILLTIPQDGPHVTCPNRYE